MARDRAVEKVLKGEEHAGVTATVPVDKKLKSEETGG